MASISKALYDIRFFIIGFAATGVFFTSVYRSGLANPEVRKKSGYLNPHHGHSAEEHH